MATPARSAFEPPPPPSGMAPARVEDYRRASGAPAALTLAIFSAALAALGVLVWITLLMERVEEQLGAKAGGVHVREISHQELQEAVQKVLTSGNVPRSPLASGALLIGTVSGLMALVLAVRSLLRQEPRRGMAIAACIISTAFLFCQMGILLMMSVSHAPR